MRSGLRSTLAAGLLLLAGCGDKDPDTAKAPPSTRPDAAAVAYVNDQAVTREQVEHLARKLGLAKALEEDDQTAIANLRESLINSRAMALLAERTLDADARRELDLQVSAYREELLVERYLREHTEPEPVGSDEIVSYYRKHPERFGGGLEKTFEMLRADAGLPAEQRNGLIRALAGAANRDDWTAWAGELGPHVSYRKLAARQDVLDEPLKGLVAKTAQGSVSPVSTAQGVLVVRVLKERKLAPRPLEEVSSQIRKMLAPLKLKEAIGKAAEEARAQVTVHTPG